MVFDVVADGGGGQARRPEVNVRNVLSAGRHPVGVAVGGDIGAHQPAKTCTDGDARVGEHAPDELECRVVDVKTVERRNRASHAANRVQVASDDEGDIPDDDGFIVVAVGCADRGVGEAAGDPVPHVVDGALECDGDDVLAAEGEDTASGHR